MKSIAFGPYIGDFKYEVFYFLPYINWVKEILDPQKIFISSHFNREFLYKNLTNEFISIDPILTVDEFAQKNHFNKNVFKIKYVTMEKQFINTVTEVEKDVLHYSFEYNRFKIPCSTFQLKYKKLVYDYKFRYSDKILFIPDRTEKEPYLLEIYTYLKDILGDRLVVMGDMKTHLQKHNIMSSSINYTSNIYKEMVDAISSCKAVICPTSLWTGISNLQGKNVLSWGNIICEYKDGKYSFGNKCKIYPRLEIKNLKKCVDKFLEEL